jgi:alkylhydroperoxidase family enzyme
MRGIVEFALHLNRDAASITDKDIAVLRRVGLTDKGIVQVCHLVSDFTSYNRLNLALQTDYDYRDFWRELAFPQSAPSQATA